MTPLRLTREQVEALGEHGPWRMSTENSGGIVAGQRRSIVSACSSPAGWPRVQIEEASKDLILAAPALRADLLTLHAEVERLRAELAKPIAERWDGVTRSVGERGVGFAFTGGVISGWEAYHLDGTRIAKGPESGDAGKRACDLALAPHYRLVGGVFGGEPC